MTILKIMHLRAYKLGIFMPFMRAHSNMRSFNREPSFFKEFDIIKNAIIMRYKLIPYIYSLFFEAWSIKVPLIRPIWLEFPGFGHGLEDQFMFGYAFLLKSICNKYSNGTIIQFPTNTIWNDFFYDFVIISQDQIEYNY